MKICPSCGAEIPDVAVYCPKCRATVDEEKATQTTQAPVEAPIQPETPVQPAPVYAAPDPADHTSEFTVEDIAQNKLYALCVHLFGLVGILVALLAAKESAFVQFHVKLKMKFIICETIILFGCAILAFLILPVIAEPILLIILLVLEIIAFVQACKGKAKDAAIIKNIGFLK